MQLALLDLGLLETILGVAAVDIRKNYVMVTSPPYISVVDTYIRCTKLHCNPLRIFFFDRQINGKKRDKNEHQPA